MMAAQHNVEAGAGTGSLGSENEWQSSAAVLRRVASQQAAGASARLSHDAMTRVLLADDQAVVRAGLRTILETDEASRW